MKQINVLIIGLMAALVFSCKKDDSTGASNPIPTLTVSGISDTIKLFTYRDTLKINPTVSNENDYDYYWTNVTANFVPNLGDQIKIDTVARTKNIAWPVVLDPGQYFLVFNVRHKPTGVVTLKKVVFNVSTLNNDGWYLVKDNAGKTDIDFIHKAGRIDNWIAHYNNGKSLEGNAVKTIFASGLRKTLTSSDLYGGLVVLTDKTAGIYRVSNGFQTYKFDSMFFAKPAKADLKNVFQPMASTNLMIINGNKAYCMLKGSLFTELPQTYNVSPIAEVGAMDLGWDLNSKSVFCFNGMNFATLANNGRDLKNMKADLKWMAGYPGLRSIANMLWKLEDNRGMLYKLNVNYPSLIGSDTMMILKRDTLAPTHGLMQASMIAGNYDNDYIYYANGSDIYMTDIATTSERLQFTLPAGEVVTRMQHVKYPVPASGVTNTVDYLAIATYKNGRYKVWLHKITTIGTLQPLSTPTFEGEGRINTVIYMEQGNGSRVF